MGIYFRLHGAQNTQDSDLQAIAEKVWTLKDNILTLKF